MLGISIRRFRSLSKTEQECHDEDIQVLAIRDTNKSSLLYNIFMFVRICKDITQNCMEASGGKEQGQRRERKRKGSCERTSHDCNSTQYNDTPSCLRLDRPIREVYTARQMPEDSTRLGISQSLKVASPREHERERERAQNAEAASRWP